MTVTVYFKNGGSATVAGAIKVTHEPFSHLDDREATTGAGIALRDTDDGILGRFLQAEIVGYYLHTETGGRVGGR